MNVSFTELHSTAYTILLSLAYCHRLDGIPDPKAMKGEKWFLIDTPWGIYNCSKAIFVDVGQQGLWVHCRLETEKCSHWLWATREARESKIV